VTEREPSRRKVPHVARRLMTFENCFAFHSLTIPETRERLQILNSKLLEACFVLIVLARTIS
jgi:hypothetical protein